MGTFKSFEDIEAWKLGHKIAVQLYRLTNESDLKRDFALRDQMRRCAISITSNIAEGFARQGDKEFAYFLNVAKASSVELRSQLILAKDLEYISYEVYDELNRELISVGKMTGGLIQFLNKHPKSWK